MGVVLRLSADGLHQLHAWKHCKCPECGQRRKYLYLVQDDLSIACRACLAQRNIVLNDLRTLRDVTTHHLARVRSQLSSTAHQYRQRHHENDRPPRT